MTFKNQFAVRTSNGGEVGVFRESKGLVGVWGEIHVVRVRGGDVGGGEKTELILMLDVCENRGNPIAWYSKDDELMEESEAKSFVVELDY